MLVCWLVPNSIYAFNQVNDICYDGNAYSLKGVENFDFKGYSELTFDKEPTRMVDLDVDAISLTKNLSESSRKYAQSRELVSTSVNTYTITVYSHGDNGYTSHESDIIRNTSMEFTVEEGSSFTITAHPDEGYRVAYIRTQKSGFIGTRYDYMDESSVAHSASLSGIKEDGTIDVYFETIPTVKPTYTITVNSHGDNGYTEYGSDVIRNATTQYTVEEGSSFRITAHPDEGYRVAYIRTQKSGYIGYRTDYVDETSVAHSASLSSIKENGTIDVYFEELPVPPVPTISFVDINVKQVCINNWDTNGDGKLSYEEAAAVTDLGNAFRSNKNITSFNELQYFTGLSSIGSCAFLDCSSLIEITMPSSVTSIGYSAFERCKGLTDLIIGRGVTFIDYEAFKNCSSLTTLTLPTRLKSIENETFSGCTSLTKIFANRTTAPIIQSNSFNGIDKSTCLVFVPEGCKSSYVNDTNWKTFYNILESAVVASGFCGEDDDNVTYTIYSDMTMVISGKGAMKSYDDWDIHINNDYYQSIKKVIIEKGVTTIGYAAFSGCTSLSSVTIPNSVIDIQIFSFQCCTSLTSITIPGNVTRIGYAAFSGCSGLTELTILNGVEYISSDAFDGCSGLTSLTIPSSVTGIDFGDGGNDGYSVGSFSGCTGLASIIVDANNPSYDSRDNCNAIIETSTNTLIVGCKNTEIPNTVSSIGRHSFEGCTGLTSLAIPNSVTEIAGSAFRGCTGLTSLYIPSSVESIATYRNYERPEFPFLDCTNLNSIIVDADNTKYDSRDNCNAIIETSTNTLIYGCKNTVIPNNITSIGGFAYWGCISLTSVTIPSCVAGIGVLAFGCPNLLSIYVERETPPSICVGGYSTFSSVDKNTCTLYVPKGCKSSYNKAEGWNEFMNIVEVEFNNNTDISVLDNAIYVEKTEGRIGGTMDILVNLKNSYPVRGFQFTLELPEGANINSWALSTNRLPSGATLSDKIATQKIEGNKITVACSLNYGDATFTGNDGVIATVNVTFVDDMEAGTYPIYLTACDVTTASGVDEDLSDVKATLVLEDYVAGDANGDGKVRIGDATTILNYIVGTTSDKFNEKAADANGDGKIRIGDATTILNIIVNQ